MLDGSGSFAYEKGVRNVSDLAGVVIRLYFQHLAIGSLKNPEKVTLREDVHFHVLTWGNPTAARKILLHGEIVSTPGSGHLKVSKPTRV
jgi:hypothetical protein